MDLSIAIVSWNTREVLGDCLRSVYETGSGVDFEVIVVDNASSDGSPEMVRESFPQARLVANSENLGFAKANNQAWQVSKGRYFLLLNPDTLCRTGALGALVRFMDCTPEAGALGPLVLNSDETLQHSWARFPTLTSEILGKLDRRTQGGMLPQTARETRALGAFQADWVGGCAMMVRGSAIGQIGLMDESLFMYNEETDWCKRLREAGWTIWVEPGAEIVHLGGRSSDKAPARTRLHLRRSKVRYFSKHHGRLQGLILGAVLATKSCFRAGWNGGSDHGD